MQNTLVYAIIYFMTKDNIAIYENLTKAHPNAHCELDFGTPFQLLVSVVLSAQCTDKRVNAVTEELFKVASTPEDFVAMPVEQLEKMIFSCGFYHNKAKHIKELSEDVVRLGGVPNTREGLMTLAGVGRKTANVVYAEAFKGNAIAVDTHVFRVANRLGIVDAKTPEQTEEQLMKVFDEDKWRNLHHLLIFQGRYVCHSQKPNCAECSVKEYCKYYKNQQNL